MSSKIRNTYFIYVLSVVISVVALVSCSTVGEDLFLGEEPAQGESDIVEVSLGLPSLSVATRTSIESDNGDTAGSSLTAKWDKGDSFGLFIRSDEDAAVRFEILDEVLEESGISEPYKFTNDNVHNLQGDIFVGRIPRMPNDADDAEPAVYNYYAYYPYDALSVATDRKNEVHCRIPNIQSGRYDDGADIMVAAARGHRLNQQRLNEVDFKFRHLTHALKITIPESKNYFGRNIDRITIEFPKPVAGDAVLDLADITVGDDAVPVLNTNGLKYRTIEVRFDEPLSPETDNTFWVFVAPVDLTGQDVVFRAYDDDGCMMSEELTVDAFKTLKQQHITPVSIPVREGIGVTWFEYSILDESSRLGEELQSLNLYLPENLHTAERYDEGGVIKIQKGDDGIYRVAFRTDELESARTNNSGTVDFQPKYESEHALLSPYSKDLDFFVVSDGYKVGDHNYFTIENVPYLFEEDFSGALAGSDNHDNPTGSFDSNMTASDLSAYNLTGWSAARFGIEAETAIRISGRTEDGWLAVARYHGRADSSPIVNIKSGVYVKVNVSFNYSMNRNNNMGHTPTMAYGYHTTAGKINAQSGNNANLNNPVQQDITSNLDGTYTNIYEFASYEIPECTNAHRLAWEIYTTDRQTGNSNSWLYIDNVRVTIVNE